MFFSQLSHTDIQRVCICENSEEEKERIKKHNTELLDLKINNQCEEDTHLDNPKILYLILIFF